MRDNTVHIFWDSSHIWGIMAWRAMLGAGFNCRLLKSKEIAQGALLGKHKASLLIAPGGSARQKAVSLGQTGKAALLHWLERGGAYMGFCGGAGLALATGNGSVGLGICPWKRADYAQRLYHMLSGNVLASGPKNEKLLLPVWWPGRFAPQEDEKVQVLAHYLAPTEDLWLADLPLARLPHHIAIIWKKLGVDPGRDFPAGQPLVISGRFGRGKYLLSYAHLETPQSPDANNLLAGLLAEIMNLPQAGNFVAPIWNTGRAATVVTGNLYSTDMNETFACLHARILALLRLGADLNLFFRRTSWLWGWNYGIHGMACNNLLAAVSCLAALEPSEAAKKLWQDRGKKFCLQIRILLKKIEICLWAARLTNTQSLPANADGMDARMLSQTIFGHPMFGGGLIEEPLNFIEDLIYLSQESAITMLARG